MSWISFQDINGGSRWLLGVARCLLPRWPMSDERIALGKSGEDLACRELERRGYAIVARRYRRRGGELDIVARDGKTTVFVEVKTRQGHRFGDAGEAVHRIKRQRMRLLALDYVMRHRLADAPCRFDVVSIHVDGRGTVVEVFQNAFDMSG